MSTLRSSACALLAIVVVAGALCSSANAQVPRRQGRPYGAGERCQAYMGAFSTDRRPRNTPKANQGLWVPSPLGPNLDWAPRSELPALQWSYEFEFLDNSACSKPSYSTNTVPHACANIRVYYYDVFTGYLGDRFAGSEPNNIRFLQNGRATFTIVDETTDFGQGEPRWGLYNNGRCVQFDFDSRGRQRVSASGGGCSEGADGSTNWRPFRVDGKTACASWR